MNIKIKKTFCILLMMVMTLGILSGCKDKPVSNAKKTPQKSAEPSDPKVNDDKKIYSKDDELPEGTLLLDKYDMAQLKCGSSSLGEAKYVKVEGMPFTDAVQAISKKPAAQPWDIQLAAPIKKPVKQWDTIVIRFYIRCVEGDGGTAKTSYIFEKAGDPYTKSLDEAITFGKEWQEFQFAFSSKEDYEEGKANLIFRMGVDKPQIMEIGGLELIAYSSYLTPEKFEKVYPKISYAGREENAAWRTEAEKRIEEIRKGDLKVAVVDASGNAVKDAKVQIKMKKHEFNFGTAVNATYLYDNKGTEDGKRYAEEIPKLFNTVVLENELKWSLFDDTSFRMKADEAIKWLTDSGIAVRGHNLIWPGWSNLPSDLQAVKGDKDGLRKRIDDHIKSEAEYYKGKVVDWDVINEPYGNHDIMDILGEDEIYEWFKIARNADPSARLYLNETGVTKNEAVAANTERILKNAKTKGVKIDGLGIQSHFGNGNEITPPEKLVSTIERFSGLVDNIKVTEMDFTFNDDALEADYMRDLMTVYFSEPVVNGILMWGFWDGEHWFKHAPVYTKDWELHPSGKTYMDLVFNKWWTNAEGNTGADGIYSTRGFLGDYDIVVEYNGKSKTLSSKLVKEGTTVKVVID